MLFMVIFLLTIIKLLSTTAFKVSTASSLNFKVPSTFIGGMLLRCCVHIHIVRAEERPQWVMNKIPHP